MKVIGLQGGSLCDAGLGKAVVQAFLDNGANVVVCDMNPQTPEYDLHEGSGEFLVYVTSAV